MQTLQINLIEPNALKILQGLEEVKLIQIQRNKPVKQDDTKVTKQEFYAKIKKSLASGLVPMNKEKLKSLHGV